MAFQKLFSPRDTRLAYSTLGEEIVRQKYSLQDTYYKQAGQVREFALSVKRRQRRFWGKSGSLDVVAAGSSANAARIGAQFLNGHFLNVQEPSSYSPRSGIIIFVSQSGESGDLLPILDKAQSAGWHGRQLIAAITNAPKSTIGMAADIVIPTYAAKESAIAATGTMTSAVATFAHMGRALGGQSFGLESLSNDVDSFLGSISKIGMGEVALRLAQAPLLAFLGSGGLRHVASEIALKVSETAQSIALDNDIAMFRHGYLSPFAANTPPVAGLKKAMFSFSPSFDKDLANYYLGLSRKNGFELFQVGYDPLKDGSICNIRAQYPLTQAIFTIIYGQALAHDIALEKGIEPGTSNVLSKVVK